MWIAVSLKKKEGPVSLPHFRSSRKTGAGPETAPPIRLVSRHSRAERIRSGATDREHWRKALLPGIFVFTLTLAAAIFLFILRGG